MCKPQTRLRSDGVSVVFVLSLQIHAIWLDFISTSSPRLLSSSSCALAGPYQFSQLSRTVSGRTPVSGLGSGNRLSGWRVPLEGSVCFVLFCIFTLFFFHDKQRDYIVGICGNKQQAIKASDSIVKHLNAR